MKRIDINDEWVFSYDTQGIYFVCSKFLKECEDKNIRLINVNKELKELLDAVGFINYKTE
jgi:hypothetical protein